MDNTQIVKEAYGHFGTGNIDGLIGLMDENISWTIPEVNGSPLNAVTNGSENVRAFFGTLSQTEEFTNFEPREFIADGNRVVVLGTSAGNVISTGKSFKSDWVHIFSVEAGKITSFLEYFDNALMERAYQKSATA